MSTRPIVSNVAEVLVFSRLKEMVTNKTDLLRISDNLNVNPSTVQKILAGSPISRGVRRKIHAALEQGRASDPQPSRPYRNGLNGIRSKPSTIQRLLEVHRLYERTESLRGVGQTLGLSPEGVRQLLIKGSKIGLFKYKPPKSPFVSKEKILQDYKRFLKLNAVAKNNHISMPYLSKLLAIHQISKEELNNTKNEGQRLKCIDQYHGIVRKLGHHPTTTELQKSKSGRYLAFQIRKLWNSFMAFREELAVEI